MTVQSFKSHNLRDEIKVTEVNGYLHFVDNSEQQKNVKKNQTELYV